MYTIFLIILSILPAALLLWYFEKQDKGHKEPLKLKWKIFRWGLFATFMAIVIELNIEDFFLKFETFKNPWIYIFLTSFVTAALVEETLKFWIVKRFIYRHDHFNEVMDGITYTIIASLGFATVENIFYVLEGGLGIGILRAFLSVPAHAIFSGIMGYYIGKARFTQTPWEERALLYKGLGFGILYHGTFNFLLFTQDWPAFFVLPLFVVMAFHLKSKIREARFDDHLVKAQPEKMTIKKALKVFTGTISLIITLLMVAGVVIYFVSPQFFGPEAANAAFLPTNIGATVLFALITYVLFRRPRNSPGKTT